MKKSKVKSAAAKVDVEGADKLTIPAVGTTPEKSIACSEHYKAVYPNVLAAYTTFKEDQKAYDD